MGHIKIIKILIIIRLNNLAVTFHEMALLVHRFQVGLELKMLVFVDGETGRKTPRSKEENLNQRVTPDP